MNFVKFENDPPEPHEQAADDDFYLPHQNERINFVLENQTQEQRIRAWFRRIYMTNQLLNFALGMLVLLAVVLFSFYILSMPKSSSKPKKLALNSTVFEIQNGTLLNETKIANSTDSQQPQTLTESKESLFIKKMVLEAWHGYEKYAWGHDSLSPYSRTAHNDLFGANSGRTIISSMSTLWVMGLKEEFEQGKKWIKEKFNLRAIDSDMNVCDLVTDFIGGLLSCYALTGDEMFLEKAKEIGNAIDVAYDIPSGLSLEKINPKKQHATGANTWFTWVGGQQLEYNYLSDLSLSPKFKSRIRKIRNTIKNNVTTHNGLYMERINVFHAAWANDFSTLSWASRQFYIGLGKSYIQTNGRDVEALQMYIEAFDAVDSNQIIQTSKTGLTYDRAWGEGEHFMKYYSCYLGALLSLGSNAMKDELRLKQFNFTETLKMRARIAKHWEWAVSLTETCHQAAKRAKVGLAPYKFNFDDFEQAENRGFGDSGLYSTGNMLNPELAESYFTLFRLTQDKKYREYAWEMAQALYTHARIPFRGYTQISNVNRIPTGKEINYQPPYFIGGTLKYLYLIFQDDPQLLPLDKWIFNSVGQPLPIQGNHTMYPSN